MISLRGFSMASMVLLAIAPMLGPAVVSTPASASDVLDAYTWVQGSRGSVPRGARAMGKDIDQAALYPCVANASGNQYAGKLATTFKRCNIAVNGREVGREDYEVPVEGRDGRFHWQSPRDQGFSWRRAVSIRSGGGFSHLCGAGHRGSWQLGGTVDKDRKCRFSFGGGIVDEASFRVLMRGDK